MGDGRDLESAKKNGGWLWLGKDYVEHYMMELSGMANKLYLYLAANSPGTGDPVTFANLDMGDAAIAKKLGITRQAVWKAKIQLLEKNLIEQVETPPRRYRLLSTKINKVLTDVNKVSTKINKSVNKNLQQPSLSDGSTQGSEAHNSNNNYNSIKSVETPKKQEFDSGTFEYKMANILRTHVKQGDGRVSPKQFQDWCRIFRLMQTQDHYKPNDIENWLRFVVQDVRVDEKFPGWAANIKSAKKFRTRCQESKIQESYKKYKPKQSYADMMREAQKESNNGS